MAGKERFHGGHFPKCIVFQAIFWYLRYSLSYRDIEELMKERGVEIESGTNRGLRFYITAFVKFHSSVFMPEENN